MDANLTLLLVDDSVLLRETLREIVQVQQPNWRVLEASNGAEGVALAKAHLPDIIFMDLNMPVVNGYQAIVQIRDFAPLQETPIVLITSEDIQAPLVVQASALCQAVLLKPFSVKEMRRLLTRLSGSSPPREHSLLTNFAHPLLEAL